MAASYFNGSIWCNIDVALQHMTTIYKKEIYSLGLTIIEWYVLQLLYVEDGQKASKLAEGLGRPATSFTPILDHIEGKDLIERRPDPRDRRAVNIYLTKQGRALEAQVKASVECIESKVREQLSGKDWTSFELVVGQLQLMMAR